MPQTTHRRRLLGRLNRTAMLFFTIAAASGMTACEGDFDPYNELNSTRLLAVRASLPSLQEGESATLDALIHVEEGTEVDYDWRWCPVYGDPSDGFGCPVAEADIEGLGLPSLSLGTDATATFTYPGDRASMLEVCRDLQVLPSAAHVATITCDRGFPVYVTLTVSTGGNRLTAIKRVELLVTPDAIPNTNPEIMEVVATQAGVETLLAMDAVTPLAAGKSHNLAVTLAEGAEMFVPEATEQNTSPAAVREEILMTWFFTRGATDAVHTGTFDGGEGLNDALENVWDAPSSGGSAELMIVVRDDRGGVTWTSHTIDVAGSTP